MSKTNCLHCGKEKLDDELYCSECQARLGPKRPKKLLIFSLIFSGLLLILTGLLIWHKGFLMEKNPLELIWPQPVAKINGEPIARSEFKERMEAIKDFIERQYGTVIFKGEEGRLLLANLEKKVLAEMIEEKLINQEAQKLGIRVSDEEVKREVEEILRRISGSSEKFEAELESDKAFKENFQNYVRHLLILNALSLAKASPNSSTQENFVSWLRQAKEKAKIEIYGWKDFPKNSQLSRCCAGGGRSGGCGGQRSEQARIDPKLEEKATTAALQAYRKYNPGSQNLTAKVIDYGCHIQVDIQRDGQVVKSYIYQNGEVEDL